MDCWTSEIDPVEVKAKIDRGDDFVLLDVREPHEYQICNIPGSEADSAGRFAEARERAGFVEREIVAHCKMGGRSAKAVDFLRQAGFKEGPQHEGRHSGVERASSFRPFPRRATP
jgi:sulfur-carrier protein adenylyltransferase/sulfurtransferase